MACVAVCAALAVALGFVQPAAAAPDWPTLGTGSSGSNVTAAQYLLRSHGHDIAADSDYGTQTVDAVAAFQKAGGLTADGVIGAQTWGGLVTTVSGDSSGDTVRAAQVELNKFGFGLVIDGQFGAATASAVTSFQNSNGLDSDGVIGPQTWEYLVSQGGSGCPVPSSADPDVLKSVYRVGTELGVSDRVLLAGFEAGVVESNMNNLPCGDRDSLGVFQQRPSQGWGTPVQIVDVAYASNSFFTRAIDSAAAHPEWSAGQVAQHVQVSEFPDRYDEAEATALELIARAQDLATESATS